MCVCVCVGVGIGRVQLGRRGGDGRVAVAAAQWRTAASRRTPNTPGYTWTLRAPLYMKKGLLCTFDPHALLNQDARPGARVRGRTRVFQIKAPDKPSVSSLCVFLIVFQSEVHRNNDFMRDTIPLANPAEMFEL